MVGLTFPYGRGFLKLKTRLDVSAIKGENGGYEM